jgi:glycosyltransferase involved in cell wall biosynthesis
MARVALVAHWDWVLYNFRLPLARRLRELGAEVTFVSPPGEYVERLGAAGLRWLPWAVSRRSLNPLTEAAAVARLVRLYRRERFTAVQHFTVKPILYGSLAAQAVGIPRVVNTFTGLGFLFSDGATPRLLRVAVFPLLRRLLHGRRVVTVVQNEQDRDRLLRARLVPACGCRLIPGSGVDVDRFAPGPGPDGVPVALLAARLLWDKGIAEFVEAARRLRATGTAGRFLVAGAPDPGNPRSIPEAQFARWAEEGAVEFLGRRDDMPSLLRQVHVAVLPSSYYEGVPRFLLEAAAAGLPLVASDIPGCRAVVEEGVNGFLVPPRDPTALTGALERLLRDEALRGAMGRASRAMAVERFDERLILAQYEALYREFVLPGNDGTNLTIC